jgi:hypothetical protein
MLRYYGMAHAISHPKHTEFVGKIFGSHISRTATGAHVQIH